MKDTINFIKHGISKNPELSLMSHLKIENNRITSYNGKLTLSCNIPIDLNCNPNSLQFLKVMGSCGETTCFKLNKNGSLNVKSDGFSANIECLDDHNYDVKPDENEIEIDGEIFLKCLKTLLPFIGSNPNHQWAQSVLISDQSAFATNNIVLLEYWLGPVFPKSFAIPFESVKAIVKINKPPVSVSVTESHATFHYDMSTWLRTQLMAQEWPEVKNYITVSENLMPLPSDFKDGLKKIKPFVTNLYCVYLSENTIRTSKEIDTGASHTVNNLNGNGAFSAEMLLLLADVIETIDFSTYPKPCYFKGDNFRGVIVGMRDI